MSNRSMLIGWHNRRSKAEVRSLVLTGLRTARAALFMPAADCLCVKDALNLGAINRETHLLAIERDERVFRRMVKQLRALEVAGSAINGWLHEAAVEQPLDLVFFDFNGTLTGETGQWMQEVLAKKLMPGATVILGFAEGHRNNTFVPMCHEMLWSGERSLIHAITDEIGFPDYSIASDVLMLRILLPGWSFKVEFLIKYHDTVQMCVYRLYDFVHCERQPLPYRMEGNIMVSQEPINVHGLGSPRERHSSNESDWPEIAQKDIPNREVLEVMTLGLLQKGVSNSDNIRECIRRQAKVRLVHGDHAGAWNSTPTAKFINEHAHVLRDLVMRRVIRRLRSKEYSLGER